jgi:hypothetical protein
MVNTKVSLLGGEEVPPLNGTLNEDPSFGLWCAFALWFSDLMESKTTGEAFATITGAIRHGLPTVQLPYVGGWIYGIPNPADRATIANGTHRLSVYHRDHTGEVVNPALDYAYRNRQTTVSLTTAMREECGCGLEGCLIHPVEGTGGGERKMGGGDNTRHGDHVAIPTGSWVTVGDVATNYANKVNAGLGDNKTPILGMSGGQVVIAEYRTLSKRSGNGNNPTQPVTYRYATVCGCGRRTCWGNICTPDSEMRFVLVMTGKGRTMAGLDPRGPHSVATIRAALEAQSGVEAVVVSNLPFESGGGGI